MFGYFLSFFLAVVVLTCNGQDKFSNKQPTADEMQMDKKSGEMLEALLDREEERCYGRRCSHSEECCKGAACVDIEGYQYSRRTSGHRRRPPEKTASWERMSWTTVSGTCLPIHGGEFYQPCQKDEECGFGLVCADSGNFSPSKNCQLDEKSILKKKGFNDECITSADCDATRGLCCQMMRRHRMAPKKLCYYFQDPESCIGHVVTSLKPMNYIPNPYFKARLG